MVLVIPLVCTVLKIWVHKSSNRNSRTISITYGNGKVFWCQCQVNNYEQTMPCVPRWKSRRLGWGPTGQCIPAATAFHGAIVSVRATFYSSGLSVSITGSIYVLRDHSQKQGLRNAQWLGMNIPPLHWDLLVGKTCKCAIILAWGAPIAWSLLITRSSFSDFSRSIILKKAPTDWDGFGPTFCRHWMQCVRFRECWAPLLIENGKLFQYFTDFVLDLKNLGRPHIFNPIVTLVPVRNIIQPIDVTKKINIYKLYKS